MPGRYHLKVGRKRRCRQEQDADETKHVRFLTPEEIMCGRLDLAMDMMVLMAQDGALLPPSGQRALQTVYEALRGLRHQLRDWP